MTRDTRSEAIARVPPQAIEAEQAVLGGLMLDPEAFSKVRDLLTHEDFYRRDHQAIWQAIESLATAEPPQPLDAVTLGEWFERHGRSGEVQNGAYLIDLAATTPSAANIRAYAEIVSEKALMRRGLEASTDLAEDLFQPDGRDAHEILASASARLAQLTASGKKANDGLRMVRGALPGVWDEIQRRYEGNVRGLPLPWSNARRWVPVLEDTDFMLIAGRPSMGKTVLGLECADYAASLGRNVAVFSLEMSTGQLLIRLLSRRSGIPAARMLAEQGLQDEDWSRLNIATKELAALPLAIDDTASLTIGALGARAQRMHTKVPGGLGLVVIDYLQLMAGKGKRDEKRSDEISEISRGCKLLAKALRCPVIGLSQLNRGLESRTDKRPVMSDLRESGALEQDADIVAFAYRDDYYTKEACGAPGVAELIFAKNRMGPTGTAYLSHDLPCSRFFDYDGRPSYAPKSEPGAKERGGKRKAGGYDGPASHSPEDSP